MIGRLLGRLKAR